MENPQKNKSLQKFRTAVRWILIKLKPRKPKASKKIVLEEQERDMPGTVGDSTIDLRTQSLSINSVISNLDPWISDNETVASGKSYERDVKGSKKCDERMQFIEGRYVFEYDGSDYDGSEYDGSDYGMDYGIVYGGYFSCYGGRERGKLNTWRTGGKRLPNAGSNFSKIPILSETPKIQNPAAWVSSKTQKDTKPIRN